MGRKILTEAGYEVVAVSNGAAAVKKIAEQKPDIIILDVYMPGYSGLEVCEKVRGSMETLKTPVLLTVGKMEPYKPEDANRVRADGVIVKPFEASDLLAIVKKFEERIGQAPALVQQPALVERFQEENEVPAPAVELPVEHAEPPVASRIPQPTVEVPDHMATTSAFSDLLGTEPSVSGNHFDPLAAPVVREVPVAPAPANRTIPEYELPVSWREREDLDIIAPVPTPAEPAALAHSETVLEPEPVVTAPSPVASRPLQIPVYEDHEPAADAYDVVPTAAPPTGEIEIPREPELEETAAEATRNTVAETTEPDLVPTRHAVEPTPSPEAMAAAELAPVEEFTPAGFQDIPADIASHLPPLATETAPPLPPEKPAADALSDADFEARVAAAMSAYSHAAPQPASRPAIPEFSSAPSDFDRPSSAAPGSAREAAQSHVETGQKAVESHVVEASPATQPPPAPVEYYPAAREFPSRETRASEFASAPPAATAHEAPAPAAERQPAIEQAAPVFEYSPPVSPAPAAPAAETPASEPAQVLTASEPEPEPVPMAAAGAPPATEPLPSTSSAAAEAATGEAHAGLAAGVEARLPEAAAAGAAAGADHHTISQAVHRVMERLKPELVEEILRELKSNKE